MGNNKELLAALDKKITLEGVEAHVIEQLLGTKIEPRRSFYDHDNSLAGMILPVSVTRDASSVIASLGYGWKTNRVQQTTLSADDRASAQFVDLSDEDMGILCALWIQYRVEMIKKG